MVMITVGLCSLPPLRQNMFVATRQEVEVLLRAWQLSLRDPVPAVEKADMAKQNLIDSPLVQ